MPRIVIVFLLISSFAASTTSSAFCQEEPPASGSLGPGDHQRKITVDGRERKYLVHVPQQYDAKSPVPLVLALHGAAMDGSMMVWFSGLNKKSDAAGFIVVYPSGTGIGPFRTWNAGGFRPELERSRANDVTFVAKLLDELGLLFRIDTRRVYACGMSNGGMMCYRLAAELSDRIAAIAPVAGTMAIEEAKPTRPVPVIHFHGTQDTIVPYAITRENAPPFLRLQGVEESISTWVKLNECQAQPETERISPVDDMMTVLRKTYRGGRDGAEVVLVVIEEGGHTWPGQRPPIGFIGKSTTRISANDLMWEFFQKHQLK